MEPYALRLTRTTFTQETAGATNCNGLNWVTLHDGSGITVLTRICGFTVTVAGAWAGLARIRITNGAGTVKLWPFADYLQQNDLLSFASGVQTTLAFPVFVPAATGYLFQFSSSDAADGVGETLQLNNLDVIGLD